MASGDRFYTARGARLELRAPLFDIRLASGTGLDATELTRVANRFVVWCGSASFLIREIEPGGSFGAETPNAAVTFERPGEYRVDVDGKGSTRVAVDRGAARVSAAGVAVPVGSGDVVRIEGIHGPVREIRPLPFHSPRAVPVEARLPLFSR